MVMSFSRNISKSVCLVFMTLSFGGGRFVLFLLMMVRELYFLVFFKQILSVYALFSQDMTFSFGKEICVLVLFMTQLRVYRQFIDFF